MASFTLPEVSNQSGPPLGVYVLRLIDIEEVPEGQYGPQAKFVFSIKQVIDSDDDGAEELVNTEMWRYAALSMGPKSHMRKLVEGILGRPLAEGEHIDTDALVGKTIKGSVTRSERPDGSPGANKLDPKSVVPYKPKSEVRAEAKAAKPQDDEDELFD